MKRTIVIECPKCGGTGLIQSHLCRDSDCAFVCDKCGGTGKIRFRYTKFEGRKERKGINRVFESSFGFSHFSSDQVADDGTVYHFSKYGCTYEEWKKGVKPAPMEDLICPAKTFAFNNSGLNGMYPCSRCLDGLKGAENINYNGECAFYQDKAKCWKEWHEKQDKNNN